MQKVVIAEDSTIVTELIQVFFHEILPDYELFMTENGAEAVAKALEVHPDLIILDINMPVMDGIEAARSMRTHRSLADTPILAWSTNIEYDKCRQAGINDFIEKPIQLHLLKEKVCGCLNL
ncbi:response regulator [Spirochaeta dissipatitropha]